MRWSRIFSVRSDAGGLSTGTHADLGRIFDFRQHAGIPGDVLAIAARVPAREAPAASAAPYSLLSGSADRPKPDPARFWSVHAT